MKSPEDITKFIATAAINTNTKVNEAVLAQLFHELENAAGGRSAGTETRTWRIPMKSRITRIAAAAVVIIAVSLGIYHWSPEGQPVIEIPPELAQMPIEQLMDIHLGKTESAFDSDVVAVAFEQALNKLGAMEILALAKTSARGSESGRPRASARRAAYHPKPVSAAVEAADIIIRARVTRKELDAGDLKAAILKRELDRHSYDHFPPYIRTDIELEVLEGYPKLPGDENGKLLLHPPFNTRRLGRIKQGNEYIIALHDRGGVIWMLPYGEGIYPVDPNSQTVSGFRADPMPLDEAWHFICDCYDAIRDANVPPKEALEYWTQRLQSDDLTESWTAVEYFNTLPEPPVDALMIVEAVQRQIKMRIEKTEENRQQFGNMQYRRATFTKEAIQLLLKLADGEACERMLAMYHEDKERPESFFNSDATFSRDLHPLMLRVIMSLSQDGDTERLKRYLGQVDRSQLTNTLQFFIRTRGKDIEQILLYMIEDPAGYGIPDTDTLQLVWYGLAKRAKPEFRAYIEDFLADPENTDLGVEHYENDIDQTVANAKEALSAHWPSDSTVKDGTQIIRDTIERYRQGEASIWNVAGDLRKHLQPKDTEFIPFLSEIVTKQWEISGLIATRIPDPCFVEPLREAIAHKYHGDLARALYACGAEEEAVELAYAHLAQYIADPNRPELRGQEQFSMWHTIRVLGQPGDETVRDVVEAATYGDVFRGRYVSDLQAAAIMALARVARESGTERLRELYSGHDYYMRIAAAVSLYYLGDDTGYELLEHFINHTERSVPAIEMRWHVDMHGGKPFHDALLYFRSPETDQLFLERLRNGVGGKDIEAIEVAKDHKAEVLPILVKNLSSRHRWSRKNANEMLKKLTGQSFGFDPAMHAGRKQEATEQWQSYVEDYLADPQD